MSLPKDTAFLAPFVAEFHATNVLVASVGYVPRWTVVRPGHPMYGHTMMCKCDTCALWTSMTLEQKRDWVFTGKVTEK